MELLQTGFSDFETGFNEFDESVLEGELNDGFVFFHGDGTSGVDDVTSCLGVGIDAVDGSLDQFFLEMR